MLLEGEDDWAAASFDVFKLGPCNANLYCCFVVGNIRRKKKMKENKFTQTCQLTMDIGVQILPPQNSIHNPHQRPYAILLISGIPTMLLMTSRRIQYLITIGQSSYYCLDLDRVPRMVRRDETKMVRRDVCESFDKTRQR